MPHLINRRAFIKGTAATAALAVLTGCQMPRRWVTLEPFVRAPEEQLAGQATWFASTCRMCPGGCGILVRLMNGRALKLEGNPEHPLNRGKLCPRGQAGLQLLYSPDRLSGPVKQATRGSHTFDAIAWNDALNMLSAQIQKAGSGVAVWGGATMSGHVYDLFKRLTAALQAPAPLIYDLFSAVNGYTALTHASEKLLGRADLPVYDLAHADVILSFGANLLGASLTQARYGIEYGNFRSQPLGKRGYLVQLEPRMSITGAKADRWLPVRPGAQVLVAQAIARIIADQNLGGERAGRAAALASKVDVNAAAAASDISVEQLTQIARVFAEATHAVAIPGSELAGRQNADDAVSAIHILNVIAGAAGQPGGVTLAAAPTQSGLAKAAPSTFAEAQQLVERMRRGEVKLLIVHGANPAYDLPDKSGFADALKNVPFVVSFAPTADETAALADLIMPDRTYLEAWGYDVVSPSWDQPVVSSQQPVVTPVFDSRATGDVLLTLAKAIPAATTTMNYPDEVAFLKETVVGLGPGAAGGSGADLLWARFQQHGGWWQAKPAVAPPPQPQVSAQVNVPPAQFNGDEKEYPYFLHIFLSDMISGAQAANMPWLQAAPDPLTTVMWQTWIEMHPDTAKKLGVEKGDIVQVTSPDGELVAPVYIFPAIRPDTVAIPLGQGHAEGRYARNRGANAMRLVGAQAEASGSLTWATQRVKLARTGKHIDLATFEWTEGVDTGFINAGFPGQ